MNDPQDRPRPPLTSRPPEAPAAERPEPAPVVDAGQLLHSQIRELHARLDELREQQAELLRTVREADIGTRRNIGYAMEQESVRESAQLARQHMLKAASFTDPIAMLEHALSLAPAGGLALEFGVFSGKTLRVIAGARKDGRVWGFDSFEGLPEAWRSGFPAGAFATQNLPDVPGAELVVGWFDATLPQFLVDHTDAIDFLHIDCDLYSSTKTVLDLAGGRLRPGTIVMFDEYFNYPGWREHEYKAWVEYAERTGTKYEYVAYTSNNEQVALRIVD